MRIRRSAAARTPALPRDVDPESLSRLPLVKREAMDEQGQRFFMGNYAMTAVILDAVDQQLRPDQPPLLPRPSGAQR